MNKTRKQLVPTLTKTAQEINAIHAEIESEKSAWLKTGIPFLQKAILLGEYLISKKTEVGHGNWLTWQAENLNFTHDQVSKYIRTANFARERNLKDEASMAQVLLLCNGGETEEEQEPENPFKPSNLTWIAKLGDRFLAKAAKEEWAVESKLDLSHLIQELILLANKLGIKPIDTTKSLRRVDIEAQVVA